MSYFASLFLHFMVKYCKREGNLKINFIFDTAYITSVVRSQGFQNRAMFLTLFTVGIFGAAWPKRSLFPKILHAHPVTMKLGTVIPYLKKIRKHHESRETPLRFCWHQHFFIRTQQLLLCHFNTKFIILFFFEFWRVVLINLVAILMTSAKFATLGLLRIRVFWNKGYDVHDC